MTRRSEDIRNFALIGHAGAGKTTLAEALLQKTGAISERGSIERGTTVADYDPQEKQLGHSMGSSVCSLDFEGIHANMIDTPGFADFIGRALNVLPAVETGALVVSAVDGVESMSMKMMDKAKNAHLCRMVIVNKIDHERANPAEVLNQVQEVFGTECLPLNLPAEKGAKVVDCYFAHKEEPTDFSSVEDAHTQILDQVVEVDEDLMNLYLEQGDDLEPAQLHDAFEKALREGHLIPVCFVSAETGAGLDQLLQIVKRLLPTPLEGNPPTFFKGEGEEATEVEVKPDPDGHIIGHCFKVETDPFTGKLGVFRVHQGTVKSDSQLYIGNARKPFKVGHLFKLQGKEHIEIDQAVPGDICAVVKVNDMHFDAVLHDSQDESNYHLESVKIPPAMFGLAVQVKKRGDEAKLSDALGKLNEEDLCVRLDQTTTGETVIYGLGAFHLRVLLERMAERYHVEVETHEPSIAYRETISKAAKGHHRHRKQTGGAGQFGEVYLEIEPLKRGEGFQFVNSITGGVIPGQFIPAVEKGVQKALTEGALAGYPMSDVRVSVYDGKYHPVDSKEVAFVAAGRKAFLDAVEKAGAIVLEPIVDLEIVAPSHCLGDIAGDLSSKRGKIVGNSSLPRDRISITGELPLAEIPGFQTRLKAITAGEGEFTLDFRCYEQVPHNVQQGLVEEFQRSRSED